MGSLSFYVLEVLVVAAVVVVVVNVKFRRANHVSFPPGPPAEPLIGHARLIPQAGQAEFYHEMRKSYGEFRLSSLPIPTLMIIIGDVLYFNALGSSIVVLNSVEAAVNLMAKRNAIYSDRPPLVMLTDMWVELPTISRVRTSQLSLRLGYFPSLALLRYGKRFQKHRQLFHAVFSQAQIHTFEDTQIKGARVLLKGLIENPEAYDWLVRR